MSNNVRPTHPTNPRTPHATYQPPLAAAGEPSDNICPTMCAPPTHPPTHAHHMLPTNHHSLLQENRRSAQNPVMFYDRDAQVLTVLHTSQVAYAGQGTAEVRAVRSRDLGRTWDQPQTLFSEPGAFVRNQLVPSLQGEWLLPMYYTPDGFFEHESQYSTVRRSSDSGLTWRESVMAGTQGKLVQPSVVRLHSNRNILRAFFRSRHADYIYYSDSEDEGMTWSPPRPTRLPNNNSGIQACMLRNGALVIVFNNVRGELSRWPLSVALSLTSEGVSWDHVRDLEPMHGSTIHQDDESDGEYSYPSIIQGVGSDIHISYTFRRETIKYVRIAEEWIKGGGTVGEYTGPDGRSSSDSSSSSSSDSETGDGPEGLTEQERPQEAEGSAEQEQEQEVVEGGIEETGTRGAREGDEQGEERLEEEGRGEVRMLERAQSRGGFAGAGDRDSAGGESREESGAVEDDAARDGDGEGGAQRRDRTAPLGVTARVGLGMRVLLRPGREGPALGREGVSLFLRMETRMSMTSPMARGRTMGREGMKTCEGRGMSRRKAVTCSGRGL
eukprot:jgi/Mesvir1/4822/Mv11110-RA.2